MARKVAKRFYLATVGWEHSVAVYLKRPTRVFQGMYGVRAEDVNSKPLGDEFQMCKGDFTRVTGHKIKKTEVYEVELRVVKKMKLKRERKQQQG